MYKVVHDDEPSCGSDVVPVRVPGIEKDGQVMVPVEEDERLFTQNDKRSVTELDDLREHKRPRPERRCRTYIFTVKR